MRSEDTIPWETITPRLQELAKNKSLSNGEIAIMLAGEFHVRITRNAVIGKLRRIGVVRERVGFPTTTRRIPLYPNKPKATKPVSIAELQPHHCRWPLDVDGVVMYCGAQKVAGLSYCAQHCEVAFYGKSSSGSQHGSFRLGHGSIQHAQRKEGKEKGNTETS